MGRQPPVERPCFLRKSWGPCTADQLAARSHWCFLASHMRKVQHAFHPLDSKIVAFVEVRNRIVRCETASLRLQTADDLPHTPP